MRKIIAFFMVVSLLSIGLAHPAGAKGGGSKKDSPKIGYVDIGKVVEEYSRAKEVKESLRKEQEVKREEIDRRAEEIKKLEEELKGQESLLKEEEKKKRAETIENKKGELRQLFQDYDLEMRNRVNQEQRQVMEEICETVESFGSERGYTLILDSREVLYGKEDLTDEVVKLLNKTEKPSN